MSTIPGDDLLAHHRERMSKPTIQPEAALPIGKLQQAHRWLQIVRYHQPKQLVRRLWNRTMRPVLRFRPSKPLSPQSWRVRRGVDATDFLSIPETEVSARSLQQGRLKLIGLEAEVGSPIQWDEAHLASMPPLWVFHLHYHEYLLALAAEQSCPSAATWRVVWDVIESWLDAFGEGPPQAGHPSWHPYCISRRIAVWTPLFYRVPTPTPLRDVFLTSLAQQADWLRRNLERDLGGNHLWENAKGLIIAGCFFDGAAADRWRRVGIACLTRCLQEQLLPSGEHFERSPAYHEDLCRGLNDLVVWLQGVDRPAAQTIATAATRMADFGKKLRHPDGLWPLFGDSTLPAASPALRGEGKRHPPDGWVGDYYMFSRHDHRLIFDAGAIGPDHLPAHAHADLLGFELSAFGQRLFVDGGTHSYTGNRRSHYRSSKAHNILTLDDVDHADLWSSFRMGRRGHVLGRVSGECCVSGNSHQPGDPKPAKWALAWHNAYRHLGVELVLRGWLLAGDDRWWSFHLARGSSRVHHRFRERLQIHPAWQTDAAPMAVRLSRPDRSDQVLTWEPARGEGQAETSYTIEAASYSPRFYEEQECQAIVIEQQKPVPMLSGWTLGFSSHAACPQLRLLEKQVELSWQPSPASGERLKATIPLPSVFCS